MKKFILFLLPGVMLAGCSREFDSTEPLATEPQQAVTSESLTRAIEGAIYNESTDSWMIHRADPFTLANVQAAYDKLAAGSSAQALTAAQAAEFPAGRKLAPTHYALKIYPRDEEEQWRVEMMEDVDVAYIPFCYAQLTREEAERVERSGMTRSAANTFAERSPYTVTYENEEVTDGGPTGPVTFQLPILYTVWPASKPFPEDLEYVVDYPVYLPELPSETETKSNAENDAMNAIFGEAITIARGEGLTRNGGATRTSLTLYTIRAILCVFDDTPGVARNVPMPNIKIQSREGSYIHNTVSGSDGLFTTYAPITFHEYPDYSYQTMLYFTYQDPQGRWKITTGNSSNPHFISKGICEHPGVYVPSETPVITLTSYDPYQANKIHRAANYFYNVQNVFTKYSISGGLKIIANSTPNGSTSTGYIGGSFSSPRSGSSNNTNTFINIWNNGTPNAATIGTTLHELGHFAHFRNNNDRYRNTPLFLKEAFSLYSGWYLAHEYYRSLGLTIYPDQDITAHGLSDGQGRQTWDKTSRYYYTPLLVDLTDNMNQRSYYGYFNPMDYPNDNLKNAPASVVWGIITTSQNWTQYRTKLQSYAGTGTGKYYTVTQFNEWIAAFDEWLVNYPEYLTKLQP